MPSPFPVPEHENARPDGGAVHEGKLQVPARGAFLTNWLGCRFERVQELTVELPAEAPAPAENGAKETRPGGVFVEREVRHQRARGRPDEGCRVDRVPAPEGRQEFAGSKADSIGVGELAVGPFDLEPTAFGVDPAPRVDPAEAFEFELREQVKLPEGIPGNEEAQRFDRGPSRLAFGSGAFEARVAAEDRPGIPESQTLSGSPGKLADRGVVSHERGFAGRFGVRPRKPEERAPET
jgi:hypothetical protein